MEGVKRAQVLIGFCAYIVAADATVYPRLPLTVASSWPKPSGNLFPGDLRVRVQTSADQKEGPLVVQAFWRLRAPVENNPNPWTTALVTDGVGSTVSSTTRLVSGPCGIVEIDKVGPNQTYYVYPLPHDQSGGGAGLHFSWMKATARSRASIGTSTCDVVDPSSSMAVALETRDEFHGFNVMEQAAHPAEVASLRAQHKNPLLVFPEPRERPVRLLHTSEIQADWAHGPSDSLSLAASAGEFLTFQTGLYANIDVVVHSVEFSDLVDDKRVTLASAAAFRCFNLQGTDITGQAFNKTYTLGALHGGSLWFGLDLPQSGRPGSYTSQIRITHSGGTESVSLTVVLGTSSDSSTPRDEDIYKLERLRWLDSTLGIDETVPYPYKALVTKLVGGAAHVSLMNKAIEIGSTGFPTSVHTISEKARRGKTVIEEYSVLAGAVAFELLGSGGVPISMRPSSGLQLNDSSPARTTWLAESESSSGALSMTVKGSVEFDSYLAYEVNFTARSDVQLEDMQLQVNINETVGKWMAGMGADPGGKYRDLVWKWDNASARNSVWMGRAEAGLMVRLKDVGSNWMSPMFGKDDAIIPSIPASWGGVGAVNGAYGANVTNHKLVTTSGPRLLRAGQSVVFLFDMVATPGRPVNLTDHWRNRQVQVGYGAIDKYLSPQDVASKGASVVTLHQGVPGEVNGTLVNPYINYPFTPKEVTLMANYSQQAKELGMRMKYYYTIRELSNHVAELFPLLSLDGEVFSDTDPYTIAQKGYCHDADCHGGSVFLHEHVVTNYTSCWQQALADGEWDAALCDIGVGRWFNYYLEGAHWSATHAPYLDGIYYDGINFDRDSMIRIRKTVNSAMSSRGTGDGFLLDLHSGNGGGTGYQACISYLTHYAYVDSLWNGEGFNFNNDPDYWLVEASGLPMGLSGDMLGGSAVPFQGMLFGMTNRNDAKASTIWQLWDNTSINESTMVGWWEDDAVVKVHSNSSAPILATTYVTFGKRALVVVASWSAAAATVALDIDWATLGFGPKATVVAPSLPGMQVASNPSLDSLPVAAKSGVILLLTPQTETYNEVHAEYV